MELNKEENFKFTTFRMVRLEDIFKYALKKLNS